MLTKIQETIQNYLTVNREVLDYKEVAELQAQIDYLGYLKNNKESKDLVDAKERILKLQSLLFKVTSARKTEDIELTRREFLTMYSEAVDYMFDDKTGENRENNPIYGKDVTIHWNGVYCNCSDGASAYEHISDAIEGILEEEGDVDE